MGLRTYEARPPSPAADVREPHGTLDRFRGSDGSTVMDTKVLEGDGPSIVKLTLDENVLL